MTLMTLVDISLEIGDQPILRQASLALEPEERVCLIGRNGAGKSTLMRIITGEQAIDAGEIHMRQDLRISQLEQELPALLDITVHEYVADGLSHLQQLINEYQAAAAAEPSEQSLRDMEHLQRRIEAEGGWNIDKQIERTLTDLKLPAERKLSELSGGWRRRVSLAKALVSNPELLLLDEPTNHLDLSTIQWLEDRIRGFAGSVLFITHDRAFLQRLATRIVEIDRTRLSSWPGDYRNFLRRKEEALEAEAREQQLFQKKLEEEEVWIRQGIKARRTRNEGRVRALEALRNEAEERHKLKPTDKARITIEEADASGRKVIEMHNVHYRYDKHDEHELISGLSLKIMRGDRIGLVGNNGVGKSTLLRMMLGELLPDAGTVKLGTNLAIGYFDQLRRELDPDRTIAELVGNGKDFIRMNGKDRHVIGYLRGFLFSAKRAMTKVGVLSGGERNRVILARLFTKPSNFLILDEPTNDLDVETLEVLEDRLMEYPGTLIVVSHDREFLDNVVSSVLVFEEGGKIEHYIGGFSDWQRRGRKLHETDNPNPANNPTEISTGSRGSAGPRKLSYKYQRELELLPEKTAAAEQRVARLQQQVGAPDFYSQSFAEIQPVLDELADAERALNALLERWVALEDMQKS